MRSASRPSVWFWIFAAVIGIAAATAAVAPVLYRTAVLGSGFLAQRLCGDVFISKRDPDVVLAEDLSGPGYELLRFFQPSVDRKRRLVTASAFGIGRQISVFREGLGCTHVVGKSGGELRDETANLFATPQAPDLHALWPEGGASILRRFRKVWTAPRSKGRWTRLSPSLIPPIPAIHVRWWSSIKAASWPSGTRLDSMPPCRFWAGL
jgi:hypothetical protein